VELSRDDHEAMHRQARERSIREIVATLDAHVDSGDGWCASAWHNGEPRRHPCGIRYHFEGVLDGLRRQA
jgi:hypothetical protein